MINDRFLGRDVVETLVTAEDTGKGSIIRFIIAFLFVSSGIATAYSHYVAQ